VPFHCGKQHHTVTIPAAYDRPLLSPTKYSQMKFHENLAAAELFHADGHVRKFLRSRLKIKLKYSMSTLCSSAQPPDHSAFLAHHFSSQQQLNQTTARPQSIACMEDSTGDRRQTSHWPSAHPPQLRAATPEEVHLTKYSNHAYPDSSITDTTSVASCVIFCTVYCVIFCTVYCVIFALCRHRSLRMWKENPLLKPVGLQLHSREEGQAISLYNITVHRTVTSEYNHFTVQSLHSTITSQYNPPQ
jgi:hypothetical protein